MEIVLIFNQRKNWLLPWTRVRSYVHGSLFVYRGLIEPVGFRSGPMLSHEFSMILEPLIDAALAEARAEVLAKWSRS